MAISKAQSFAMVDMIRQANLTAVEVSDLAVQAATLAWADNAHATAVLDALEPKVAPPPKKRRAQQDFTNLVWYGTEQFWTAFGKPGLVPYARLQILLDFVAGLGLRCPTEPTLKMMTSLWLVASHDKTDLATWDFATKKSFFVHTKSAFDAFRKKLPEPMEYVDSLHADPMVYMRDHGVVWRAAFAEAVPVQPTIDPTLVATFDASYGCRSATAAVQRHEPKRQPLPLVLSPARPNADSSLERVATQFMSQMQAMAMSQSKMMEVVLGGGGYARGLRSMAALEDRPQTGIHIVGKASAAVEVASDSQPELRMQRSHSMAAAASSSPQPLQALADNSFEGSLDAMLSAHADRKSEKVAAKKVAADVEDTEEQPKENKSQRKKKNKRVQQVEQKVDEPVVAESKKSTKKKCATKMKAKPEEPVAAVAALVLPTELTCPKKLKAAKAKAKAVMSAAPKAKAKAVTSTVRKGKPKVATRGLILGCSKCRWKVIGCGQCRRSDFAGHRWNANL